jgi:Fe-S cluster biogenesis protein NfuA
MKMGLERGLREKIPEIVDVVQVLLPIFHFGV